MDNINNELRQRNLIDQDQYQFLEAMHTNKIISVYYELRIMLYLGILLFSGGLGYFAYQNMGETGHLLAMTLITTAISGGFIFLKKYAKPYSNLEVTANHAYFDYILVLIALLIISLFTYVQVYFDLVQLLLKSSSYISAGIFVVMAYRYDSRALLAMAITALGAAVGLSVAPINWITGDWLLQSDLYVVSIILGLLLVAAGQISQLKKIKRHFRFTYLNFGLLIYFGGCLYAMFDSNYQWIFALLSLISGGIVSKYTWQYKDFLFFIYANIAGYIAVTYLLLQTVNIWNSILIVYYFPATILGYITLLFQIRGHFKHE